MLQFSPWKQMGGGDTRILHFQHLSFLLLCGGLTNSLSLKIAERISDSSSSVLLMWRRLFTSRQGRQTSLHWCISPCFFSQHKGYRKPTFIPALHIAVIKNVWHSASHLKGVICTLFLALYKPQSPLCCWKSPSATVKLSLEVLPWARHQICNSSWKHRNTGA